MVTSGLTHRPGSPGSGSGSGEAGYTMVALAVAVAILAILVTAAMPMWSTVAQREREEELIFRGWQYAEAIRVFQQRHGRLPIRLEELVEVKPRSIRRLWKDPITDEGEWGLVFQGAQGSQIRGDDLTGATGPGGQPGAIGPDGRARSDRDRNPGRGRGRGGRGGKDVQTTGPIVGVHSRSTDESLKVLFGEEQYDRWTFTVDRLTQVARSPLQVGLGANPNLFVSLPSPRWIGRPFREGIMPEGGNLPGPLPGAQGTGPDGRPARPGVGNPVPSRRSDQ